jgi:hypothetical protein
MRPDLECLYRIIAALLIGALSSANAQTPVVRLGPPSATLTEDFSEIVAVRELSDGRLLIGDRREERIVVADFRAGSVTPTSRQGLGPGEFSRVTAIWPLGGDSSLMVDGAARRWHVFVGTSLSRLIPPDAPAYAATDGLVLGADTLGALLARIAERFERSRDENATDDSTTMLRVLLTTGKTERIATLRSSATRVRSAGNEDGRPVTIRLEFPILGVGEEPLLMQDGWLAIARLDPYRVDWRSPDGLWRRGKTLPHTEVAITAREKAAYRVRRERAGGRPGSPADGALWMPTIPPFQAGGLLAAPNGNLLVARNPSADAPEMRYDEVDRNGRIVRQFMLGAYERIVATGRRSIYVAVTDDDGLQHLHRHAWR